MKNFLLLIVLCCVYSGTSGQIIAPDTVCAGTAVNFTTTVSAVTYSWDFNAVSVVHSVSATSLYHTTGGTPTWTTFNDDGGNYYSFTVDYTTGHITRLSFGASIYSTPVVTDLGTFGGTGGNTEGIDIVKDDVTGNWYGLVVNYSQMIVLSFGASLSLTPTATVTTYAALQWPHQVTIKKYLGNWSAFVANRNGNIVRFDFGGSLTSAPVVTTIPNVGGVTNPCNFSLYEQAGNWYMIITNLINGSLSRYEFGTNLLNNTPTGTLLAPPGSFTLPRPVNLLTDCENHLIGYMVTEPGQLYKLDFGGDITTTPVITALGASGTIDVNSATPCAYNDSFSFLLVNYSGSIVKYYPMYFTPADFVNYYTSSQSYTFATAGTYSVSLFCDMGYPSGPSVYCKNIVVQNCASCLTNSLIINTGYDPTTNTAIAGSGNGATPVIDPHWYLTAVSPGVAAAIAVTPIPGLVEVAVGGNANVISAITGSWAANPGPDPGGWISCLNSNTYYTSGTGTIPYNMTLGRKFRTCVDDSIKITFYVANDNYIPSTNIDGTLLGFSQPAIASTAFYSTYAFYTQTVYLAAGTHTLNVTVADYDDASTDGSNPTGLDLYGTVASASGLNSLVSETYTMCNTYVCASTSCNTLELPDSLHLCIGMSDTLRAVMTGTDSIVSYTWTPATGLSSSTVLDPLVTPTTSGWYHLTVQSIMPYNLVINGDFSAGNTGFTSSYTFVSGAGSLVPESVYAIDTDPWPDHPSAAHFGDHTTGTGNMMSINGASSPISVWCETVPVTPNTTYNFSAWVANWSSADVGAGCPLLQFQINGVLIGTPDAITAAPGVWTHFFSTWNSGTATVANICIYDETTAADGNDFSLDDISFTQVCIATDSEYVAVKLPDTTYTHHDTTVCANVASITLTAPSGYLSYLWSTGSTASTIVVSTTGAYWVYDSSSCAILVDTFNINFKALPVVNLGNDTSFCAGDTLLLSSIQPAGDTLLWSTGGTGDSIYVNATGTYWLYVSNGCKASDTINVLVSPHPIVDLGPDTSECQGHPIVLQSLYTYTGATYLWSNATTGVTTTVTTTGTYWLQVTIAGCSGADTIHVAILYDTFTLYTHDTSICKGQTVQVLSTGNPLQTYEWSPTAGIASYLIGSPLIVPDTSATYYVTVYYPGCPNIYDSLHIDVQPVPQVYLGGNRSVCKYDTIHITASVTPQWYTGYTYSWAPAVSLDNSTSSTVVFTAGDSTDIILTVTTPAGCKGVDSAEIIVHTDNFVHFDTTVSLCPGDSVQLKPVSSDVVTTYVWHPSIYLSDSTSSTPWVHAITTQSYWAIATSQFGCLDTLSANIVVEPGATLYLGDSVTLYPGETYQIIPQTNCVNFIWFPPAGLNYAYISDPIASPEISTKYIVYGTTEWGCKAKDSINIYIDPGTLLAVPNAFSPGNGPNNLFKLIKRGIATLNYFRIYNRWGNLVYESSDIDAGWDGTYNGKPQPYDVYVYEVEAVTNTGKLFHKAGNLTLIR